MLGDDLSVWDFLSSMTFDDFSKLHDFPWLFEKILFFQVFQTLWEPCHTNISLLKDGEPIGEVEKMVDKNWPGKFLLFLLKKISQGMVWRSKHFFTWRWLDNFHLLVINLLQSHMGTILQRLKSLQNWIVNNFSYERYLSKKYLIACFIFLEYCSKTSRWLYIAILIPILKKQ